MYWESTGTQHCAKCQRWRGLCPQWPVASSCPCWPSTVMTCSSPSSLCPSPAMEPEEGNGSPLQYSCLENPMDGGAWWAAVHVVAKSRTRLRDFTFTFHFHALEKEMATHSSVLAWRIPGTEEPGRLLSMGLHRVGHDWSDLAAAAAATAAAEAALGPPPAERTPAPAPLCREWHNPCASALISLGISRVLAENSTALKRA